MSNKKVLKYLRQLSAKIPVQFTEGRFYAKGSEFLKRNKNAKDEKGGLLDENKVYSVPINYQVSNFRRMKKLYKKYGLSGVNSYVDDIISQQKNEVIMSASVQDVLSQQKFEL